MLDDTDCFDSEQDVVENVGIFLADCCHAKQVCHFIELHHMSHTTSFPVEINRYFRRILKICVVVCGK